MSIPVTHYFSFFRSLGGVQSLLRRHLESDSRWGLDTNIVAFFDPEISSDPRVHGLGLSWKSTIASARRKYAAQLGDVRRPFAVYQDFWGLPFFADLDGAKHRIGVLHSYAPALGDCLSAHAGLVDGILCVSEALKRTTLKYHPQLDESRVAVLPLPITFCPLSTEHKPFENRPIIIGFNARLVKAQKRVDRLPRLVRTLEEKGIEFRLEFLGEGPDQGWLRQRFAGNPKIVFHGRQSGDSYWRILSAWDVILFASDYEGLPLSLLEAMSAGVLPVYPRIDSGGEFLAERVNPAFVYRTEDFDAVANALSTIKEASNHQLNDWRRICRELVKPHTAENYHQVFSAFLSRIAESPKLSASKFPPRGGFLTDYLPFALLARLYIRGFFRRNDGRTSQDLNTAGIQVRKGLENPLRTLP